MKNKCWAIQKWVDTATRLKDCKQQNLLFIQAGAFKNNSSYARTVSEYYTLLCSIVSLHCNSKSCWTWVNWVLLFKTCHDANCDNVCKSVENNDGCAFWCNSLENRVKSKLDISLSMVQTSYTGTHMIITRLPNFPWLLQCNSSSKKLHLCGIFREDKCEHIHNPSGK